MNEKQLTTTEEQITNINEIARRIAKLCDEPDIYHAVAQELHIRTQAWNIEHKLRLMAEDPARDARELLKIVKSLYLKHHCGYDDEGWEKLSNDMQNALCNAMGDEAFCQWLDEEKSKHE